MGSGDEVFALAVNPRVDHPGIDWQNHQTKLNFQTKKIGDELLCDEIFLDKTNCLLNINLHEINFLWWVSEPGALVAQWLALLTSDLEGPGSDPG
jgi:hypothetical protein